MGALSESQATGPSTPLTAPASPGPLNLGIVYRLRGSLEKAGQAKGAPCMRRGLCLVGAAEFCSL